MGRILYLYTHNPNLPGVNKKVYSKIKSMAAHGLDVQGVIIEEGLKKEVIDSEQHLRRTPFTSPQLSPLFRFSFFQNWAYQKKLVDDYEKVAAAVATEKKPFDFIIMRYSLANKGLLNFVKRFAGKVIFEHNTKEPEQYEIKLKGNKNEWNQLEYASELKYAPQVLQEAAGLIGVTNEITQYEVDRAAAKNTASITIANGFEVESVPLRKTPAFDGQTLKLIIIAGSATDWHGIDRIIKGIANYQGALQLKLTVVGNVLESHQQLVNELNLQESVQFLPLQFGKELDQLFDEHHIAFGSMAMHRVQLKEACVLKVREYISRGIPFVISYEDTDLMEESSMEDYYLKLPQNDDALNFKKIIDFAKNVYQQEHSEVLRNFALKKIDHQAKVARLKSFLENLKA